MGWKGNDYHLKRIWEGIRTALASLLQDVWFRGKIFQFPKPLLNLNTHCRLLIYQSPITPLSYFYCCKSRRALLTYLGPITTAIQTAISVATQTLTQFTAVRSHHLEMNLLITYHSHLQKTWSNDSNDGSCKPFASREQMGVSDS